MLCSISKDSIEVQLESMLCGSGICSYLTPTSNPPMSSEKKFLLFVPFHVVDYGILIAITF